MKITIKIKKKELKKIILESTHKETLKLDSKKFTEAALKAIRDTVQ